MRLNYPNNDDAKSGLERKLITKNQYDQIVAANKKGLMPLKTTALGGGIGIHGWYGSWPGEDEQDITWGCISMQNEDVEDVYDRIGLQTRIIIKP
jgi:lipoprotein-anchoring transpeptidase ErfK/SrfK